MISRRTWLLGVPFAALAAVGCTKADSATSTSNANTPLAPSEPIDPAFKGCAHSCGSRSKKDRDEARAQPGASIGDAVYCPVSGAVFRVTDTTRHRDVRGKVLYFCCDSCATWFTQHEADVLAKRGMA